MHETNSDILSTCLNALYIKSKLTDISLPYIYKKHTSLGLQDYYFYSLIIMFNLILWGSNEVVADST